MDWQTYLIPWNIGGAVPGLVCGLAAIVGLAMNYHQIAAGA